MAAFVPSSTAREFLGRKTPFSAALMSTPNLSRILRAASASFAVPATMSWAAELGALDVPALSRFRASPWDEGIDGELDRLPPARPHYSGAATCWPVVLSYKTDAPAGNWPHGDLPPVAPSGPGNAMAAPAGITSTLFGCKDAGADAVHRSVVVVFTTKGFAPLLHTSVGIRPSSARRSHERRS